MFGLDTAALEQLERETSYRWQGIDRIGRKPAQQFLGPDADKIRLSGVIFPHYRGGLTQIEQMRSQAGRGIPLPLVYAFERVGQYCGLWCVTAISEVRSVMLDTGGARRIDFNLTLTEYGEDGL